jgi:hypothetical protein
MSVVDPLSKEIGMTKPWFKKFRAIGYRPIAPEGYLVVGLMGAVFLAGSALWLSASDNDPAAQWIGLIVAAGAAIIGHVVIFKRLE